MTVAAGSLRALGASAGRQARREGPQALALGYVQDASKVDTKKFLKYAATRQDERLYQGKATDVWGGCPLFGTKQVAGNGWCSAWPRRAGRCSSLPV
ncbi:MAG: high-potential iron-sulfur protein [Chromatiales bacterium]|nr:high-potential iron-sulfur protein [Chromatiales bacterium]